MWVRKLGQKGDGIGFTLPVEVRKALGWERGDYIAVRVGHANQVVLDRFDPAQVTDRVRAVLKPEPEIDYGRTHRKRRS